MPFPKRCVLPRDVRRAEARSCERLGDVCALSLVSVLRQLADVSRHGADIVQELEAELTQVVRRSAALLTRTQRVRSHVMRLEAGTLSATHPLDSAPLHHSADSLQGNGGGGVHGNGGRGAHFRSPWQQSVNVFGSWSRPECVEELHQEAQSNLQRILQARTCGDAAGISDFEEQLCDSKPGQTFRLPLSSSEDTSLTRSPAPPESPGSKRSDFIFLPASKQLYDDETSSSVFGLRSVVNASPSPLSPWSGSQGPPPAERPRWSHGRRPQSSGETGGRRFHGVDLLQHSTCPSPSEPRPSPTHPHSLEPVTQTHHQGEPLRKSHSDLETSLSTDASNQRLSDSSPVTMDHAALLCAWNGPKGSTFSPSAWTEPYAHPSAAKPPVVAPRGPAVPPKQHTVIDGCVRALAHEPGANAAPRARSARSIAAANAFKFRERSLSTPTDSDSFGFDTRTPANGVSEQRHDAFQCENYALLYPPSGSSEDSGSTADTVSDYSSEARLQRLRSRSISLRKSKRKPPPPVRSVSLMKNLGDADERSHHGHRGLYRDGRPKSLHIPRDADFSPDFLTQSSSYKNRRGDGEDRRPERPPSLEIHAPDQEGAPEYRHWQIRDWRSHNDPYRSLSGSSSATVATVIECPKPISDSPSTSRAASPAMVSAEVEHSAIYRPHGVMSPSSGYSSQSEAPTPTAPHPSGGARLRPKIPERKSSLPSPKDPRSRLSFEMPGNAHTELSALKPRERVNRRHSHSDTSEKPGGKLSPSSSLVNELSSVRLRSVSRGEDCPDGASDTIDEEQGADQPSHGHSPPPTLPKPRVAPKPPLPKRPVCLQLKNSPSADLTLPISSPSTDLTLDPPPSPTPLHESPPTSPLHRPVPLGNIYKVMRKPKVKKTTAQATPEDVCVLYDLPPLPEGEGLRDHSTTLPPPRGNVCGAEDRKKPKVPPPVPKKPRCVIPTFTNGGSSERTDSSTSAVPEDRPTTPQAPPSAEHHPWESQEEEEEREAPHNMAATDVTADESASAEVTELRITEGAEDVLNVSPHTTEDLFTIIHRSKRRVLGRKEPGESFYSRQTLSSPVKGSSSCGLSSTQRSTSSRNENFMALLQKKGSKPTAARVSAAELLRSTNPLAKRAEFSSEEGNATGNCSQ
uniref:NHS-like protein 2 n=1 Tax=Knipowitschia caucasica TaxID=637954 RepID=A0AAV2KJ57_KNICA